MKKSIIKFNDKKLNETTNGKLIGGFSVAFTHQVLINKDSVKNTGQCVEVNNCTPGKNVIPVCGNF